MAQGTHQPAVLRDVPSSGRFLVLAARPGADVQPGLKALGAFAIPESMVVGLGDALVRVLGKPLPSLRPFPAVSGAGVSFPSTQGAVWTFVGGADPGATLLAERDFVAVLGPGFEIQEDVLAFKYAEGRDLSGYEDGTENPKGEKALATAVVRDAGEGLDGSTFVAVQRWIHDLELLKRLDPARRDELIGRRLRTNEEIPDAPPSAHVKRAAQESYEPPAFMVRRSMPYGSATEHGLYFVAYGASLDAFERVLVRMSGREDGVADGLTRFTRPVSGGYYWCPPLRAGRLDLSAIGL